MQHILLVHQNYSEIAGSIVHVVSGYIDPAVEGTTVTFDCPPGLVVDGINSSICMENGKWEPALFGIRCLGMCMHDALIVMFYRSI